MTQQISFPFVPSYVPSAETQGAAHPQAGDRVVVPSLEEVARVLTQLRGQEALIAGLMYGAGLTFEQCMAIRVGDLDFSLRVIRLGREGEGTKRFVIPHALLEDLRELSFDRACGREDRPGSGMRSYLFDFSDQPFGTPQKAITEALRKVCRSSTTTMDLLLWARSEHLAQFAAEGNRIPGAGRCDSPLDLFEKGPMIVRRGSGPARAATVRYYLWRVTGLPRVKSARAVGGRPSPGRRSPANDEMGVALAA